MIQKFKKKPVVIEAVQFMPENHDLLRKFITKDIYNFSAIIKEGDNESNYPSHLHINTLEGVMTACLEDWIIKGVNNEFYSCKPDIFEKTYEKL